MIKAKSIWLNRAEGSYRDIESTTVGSWDAADAKLSRWSKTAPSDGSYHKVDFKITYEDGNVYEGRYDLVHRDVEYPNLEKHVRDFVAMHGGIKKPYHITDEQWRRYLDELGPERVAEYRRFWDEYQIG